MIKQYFISLLFHGVNITVDLFEEHNFCESLTSILAYNYFSLQYLKLWAQATDFLYIFRKIIFFLYLILYVEWIYIHFLFREKYTNKPSKKSLINMNGYRNICSVLRVSGTYACTKNKTHKHSFRTFLLFIFKYLHSFWFKFIIK